MPTHAGRQPVPPVSLEILKNTIILEIEPIKNSPAMLLVPIKRSNVDVAIVIKLISQPALVIIHMKTLIKTPITVNGDAYSRFFGFVYLPKIDAVLTTNKFHSLQFNKTLGSQPYLLTEGESF